MGLCSNMLVFILSPFKSCLADNHCESQWWAGLHATRSIQLASMQSSLQKNMIVAAEEPSIVCQKSIYVALK